MRKHLIIILFMMLFPMLGWHTGFAQDTTDSRLGNDLKSGESGEAKTLAARIRKSRSLIESVETPEIRRAELLRLAGYLKLLEPDDYAAGEIVEIIESAGAEDVPPEARAAAAWYLLMRSRPEEASKRYLELILKYPGCQDVQKYRVALSEAFRLAGDYAHARAQLAPLLKGNNSEAEWAMLEMARLCRVQNEMNAALKWYGKITMRLPGTKIAEIAEKERRAIRFNQYLFEGGGSD